MDTVNIKRILAPVDFSDSSLNALDTAVAMAKRHGAVLNLLHIANENFQVYGHPNVDILPLTPPAIESIREASQTKLGLLVDNPFLISSKYEWMFWEMAWNEEKWPV